MIDWNALDRDRLERHLAIVGAFTEEEICDVIDCGIEHIARRSDRGAEFRAALYGLCRQEQHRAE